MIGLGDIGGAMAFLLSVRCLLMIEPLNANQSNVSFSKRLRYVCSEKHPCLPNWRKFIRTGIAMNNFIVSMKVFSEDLPIFTTDLLYYHIFNLIHGTFNLTVNAEKY